MNLEINPDAEARIEIIGNEHNGVIVVDQFLANPESMVDHAVKDATFEPVNKAGNFYPGIRAPIPRDATAVIFQGLFKYLVQGFDLDPGFRAKINMNHYSIVTIKPGSLNPIQSLPHFDTPNPNQFAALLYLFKEDFGGTSFYRHAETGFESVSEERLEYYTHTLRQALDDGHAIEPGYVNGDTDLFIRTADVSAKFNRLIIYRSQLLHSGSIEPNQRFSTAPHKGRLTANIFIEIDTAGKC